SRRGPSLRAVASTSGRCPRASHRGLPLERARAAPTTRRPLLARHEEGPAEREVHLLGGEALGALDLNAGVHATVDAVELVDQEVGIAQAQVLDELLLVPCLDAFD